MNEDAEKYFNLEIGETKIGNYSEAEIHILHGVTLKGIEVKLSIDSL